MFEGNSADTYAGKIPLVPMGSERRVPRARTRERGPPSALADLADMERRIRAVIFRIRAVIFRIRAVIFH